MKPHAAIFQYLLLVGLFILAGVLCFHPIPENNSRFIDIIIVAVIAGMAPGALKTGAIPKDTTTEITTTKTEETKELPL